MLNLKGGVAKTTSVCTLAQLVALSGKKVLLLDFDPQCDSSRLFGIQENDSPYELREHLFCKKINDVSIIKSLIRETSFPGVDIIPADTDLLDVANVVYDESKTRNVEIILRHNLQLLSDIYDYIFIDTSPYKSNLAPCTIAAANKVLSPVGVDSYSYEGLVKLINEISDISLKYSIDTKLEGIFFTNVFEREVVSRQLRDSYKTVFGEYFIPVHIRRCVAAAEANTTLTPLWNYDKCCATMRDYVYLANYLGLIEGKAYRRLFNEVNVKGGM